MIKNTQPNKSRKSESLKYNHNSWKALLLTRLQLTKSCFISDFAFWLIGERTLCSKDFISFLRDVLNENNCNSNSWKLSYKITFILCRPFAETENKDQTFKKSWWSVNEKYFCFLLTANHFLLQKHARFNKTLQMNLLICCSCSYYSFMLQKKLYLNFAVYEALLV